MAHDGAVAWRLGAEGWGPGPADAGDGARTWVRFGDLAAFAAATLRRGVDVRPLAAPELPSATHRVRPHVEHLADGVLLRAPTLTYVESGSDVLTGEVTCVVTGTTTLTFESGQADVLGALEARLRAPGPEPDTLTGGVLSSLLAVLVDAAADVEDAVGQDVEELERAVFSTTEAARVGQAGPVGQVYALKREIAEARRGLLPLGAEIADLVADPAGTRPEDAWARRLVLAVDRLDRRLDAHDALLADLPQAHLAMVSVRQNDDVRRISAWAAIAAVPTLVASVYGMNFRHMPELAQPWGYPVVLVAMLGVSVLLHRLFTRSGWL